MNRLDNQVKFTNTYFNSMFKIKSDDEILLCMKQMKLKQKIPQEVY